MVLDINGNIKIFSENGSQVLMGQIANLNVSELVGTTDVTSLNGNCYFGLIFSQYISEYHIKISNGIFANNRNYSFSTDIINAFYGPDYNLLFVLNGLNNNSVIADCCLIFYNCSTGKSFSTERITNF